MKSAYILNRSAGQPGLHSTVLIFRYQQKPTMESGAMFAKLNRDLTAILEHIASSAARHKALAAADAGIA